MAAQYPLFVPPKRKNWYEGQFYHKVVRSLDYGGPGCSAFSVAPGY